MFPFASTAQSGTGVAFDPAHRLGRKFLRRHGRAHDKEKSRGSMDFRAEQRQTQTLSPRLQHAVRLLQLSSLEFAQQVHDALGKNPFLEEDGNPDDPNEEAVSPEQAAEAQEAREAQEAAAETMAAPEGEGPG